MEKHMIFWEQIKLIGDEQQVPTIKNYFRLWKLYQLR